MVNLKNECDHNWIWDGISEPWEKDYFCEKCGDVDTPGTDYKFGF